MLIPPFLMQIWNTFVALLPRVVGAIIALIIGWIAGKALGKAISKVLDRAGVDDALRPTIFGRVLERSGITCVGFFDLIVRWFVYLIAIFAAVDILQIEILRTYMNMVVTYLPSLIAGVIILIAGFIITDYITDLMKKVGEEAGIAYSRVFSDMLRLFLYSVVIIIALSQMKIDVSVLYIFANALAWGISIGAGVGLGIALGWGFKDVIAESAKEWIKSLTTTAEKVEEVRAKETSEA
jgi:small-conductance mechanosensitive channel